MGLESGIPVDEMNSESEGSTEENNDQWWNDKYYYIGNYPNPEMGLTIASSAVLRMPLFIVEEEYPGFSLERIVRGYSGGYIDGINNKNTDDTENFAQKLVASGFINKAIKYALLYNYFGIPAANITGDSHETNVENINFGLSRQNHYNIKTQTFKYIYQNSDHEDAVGVGEAKVSTTQVYQLGSVGEVHSDIEVATGVATPPYTYAMSDLDHWLQQEEPEKFSNVDLYTNVYLCLHGSTEDADQFQVIGGSSFVEPIGINAKNSMVLSPSPTLDPDEFSIMADDKTAIIASFNTEWGGQEGMVSSAQEITENQGTTFAKYGTKDDADATTNSFVMMTHWSNPRNPIMPTYARAWLPTAMNNQMSSGGGMQIQGISAVKLGSSGDGAVDGAQSYGNVYHGEKIQGHSQGIYYSNPMIGAYFTDPVWTQNAGAATHHDYVNTLGLLCGAYHTTEWYARVEDTGIPGHSMNPEGSPGNAISEFIKNSLAGLYKLVPGLLGDTAQFQKGTADHFLANPGLTLSAAYPRIMKYISDIVPMTVPSSDPDLIVGVDPGDVITRTDGIIEKNDVLRKFRISGQSAESLGDNMPAYLGYSHLAGDGANKIRRANDKFPKLYLEEGREKFKLVTKTRGQFEYLLGNTNYFGNENTPIQHFLKYDDNFNRDIREENKKSTNYRFLPEGLSRNFLPKTYVPGMWTYENGTYEFDAAGNNGKYDNFGVIAGSTSYFDFAPPTARHGYFNLTETQKSEYLTLYTFAYLFLRQPYWYPQHGITDDDITDPEGGGIGGYYSTAFHVDVADSYFHPDGTTAASAFITSIAQETAGLKTTGAGKAPIHLSHLNGLGGSYLLGGPAYLTTDYSVEDIGASFQYENRKNITTAGPLSAKDGVLITAQSTLGTPVVQSDSEDLEALEGLQKYYTEQQIQDPDGDIQHFHHENVVVHVTKQSSFEGLPIWFYDKDRLGQVQWPYIASDPEKIEALKAAASTNPSILGLRNYGLPKWVRGIRIYPTLDNDTLLTMDKDFEYYDYSQSKEFQSVADFAGGAFSMGFQIIDGQKAYGILSTYKDFEFSDGSPEGFDGNDGGDEPTRGRYIASKIIPAMTLVCEPVQYEDGSVAGRNEDHHRYVDLRYAVEIDIDERQLVIDLVGQGVFQFAGTAAEYEDIGFDIEELVFNSNGNLVDEDLKKQYEDLTQKAKSSAYGFDFSQFPGLMGGMIDTTCFDFPPVEVSEKVDEIMANSNGDPYACTSYVCLKEAGTSSTLLRAAPGTKSEKIGMIGDNTVVKVLKEWVNGLGNYNKVRIVDPTSQLVGQEGFIPPKFLKPVSPRETDSKNIFFDQIFADRIDALGDSSPLAIKKLPLDLKITYMSEMAEAVKPDWWKNPEPYYYRAEGEFWYTVTMPYECIVDEEDFEKQKVEAKRKGLRDLLDFYNKVYTEEDIEKLIETYLAVNIEDSGFHVSDRPGSKVLYFIKVGAIYLNAFPNRGQYLDQKKAESARIISLDTRYYQTHIQQAIFSLNRIYLDLFSSDTMVTGFNFYNEARRLGYVATGIKKMLAVNGYDIGNSPLEQSVINIGFTESYGVHFISIKEQGKSEKLLTIGHDYYTKTEPFSMSNTMALLYYHRELKNPVLDWKIIFKEWLPQPGPSIVPRPPDMPLEFPVNKCTPTLDWNFPNVSEIWNAALGKLAEQLELDPRYDLGSFQFSLLNYFPPCPKPPPGRGPAFLRYLSELEGETNIFENADILDGVAAEADKVVQYIGDWVSSGEALKDLQFKIFDLDDLYEYVLNYISPELLYSKICKCFLNLMNLDDFSVPDLSINATAGSGGMSIDPSKIGKDPKEIFDFQGPDIKASFLDKDNNLKKFQDWDRKQLSYDDLFCSFCFQIPSVFLRLPSADILAELVNALMKLLEFILAQLLLMLISALLDALLQCPDLHCGVPQRFKDYGGQDLEDALGSSGLSLNDHMTQCGLLIDEQNITQADVTEMLSRISERITTSEMESLLDGAASREVMISIDDVISDYPKIRAILRDLGKIEDFFSCAGSKVKPNYFEERVDFSDPVFCQNLIDKAQQDLLDKCGAIHKPEVVIGRALNYDIDKYKNIARIIRDNDNLSSQLPPLFDDGSGTQSLLSGMQPDSVRRAVEEVIETMSIPIISSLSRDAKEFTEAGSGFVKANERLKNLYSMDNTEFLFRGAFKDSGGNFLAGIMPNEDELTPSALKKIVASAMGFKDEALFEDHLKEFFGSNIKNMDYSQYLAEQTVSIDKVLSNLEDYYAISTSNNQVSIRLAANGDNYVRLKFNPPEENDDGVIDYTNNYTTSLAASPGVFDSGISVEINGKDVSISPEVRQYIESFTLENNNTPEQIQVFANMFLESLKDFDDLQIVDQTKEVFRDHVFPNTIKSMFDGMAALVSDGNIAGDYQVKKIDSVLRDSEAIAIATGLLIAAFLTTPQGMFLAPLPLAMQLDFIYPRLTRKNAERVDFTPYTILEGPLSMPRQIGMIDFDAIKRIVKQNYDFARASDENAPFLQMPQKALLEGLISGFVQLISAEFFAKGMLVLPHFPRELFIGGSTELSTGDDSAKPVNAMSNSLIVKFIQKEFNRYLEESFDPDDGIDGGPSFSSAWKAMVCRSIAEKTEFTNLNPAGLLPGLPNEPGQAALEDINGTIFDPTTGMEESIQSWEDATEYYVRQNLKTSIQFIKDRLHATKLPNNLSMDKEKNPFALYGYSYAKPVHNTTHIIGTDPSAENAVNTAFEPSSIMDFISYDSFKGGRFFFQYYFRIEEIGADGTLTGQELEFPTGAFKARMNPHGEIATTEGVFGEFSHTSGVVSPQGLLSLLQKVANDPEYFNMTQQDLKDWTAVDLFKSIKVGVRLCYGIADKNEYLTTTDEKTQSEKAITEALEDMWQRLTNQNQYLVDTEGPFEGAEEFLRMCQREKAFKIYELDAFDFDQTPGSDHDDTGSKPKDELNNFEYIGDPEGLFMNHCWIIPLISREVELTTANDLEFLSFNLADISPSADNLAMTSKSELLERIGGYFESQEYWGGSIKRSNLISEVANSVEYKTLFSYVFPVPMMANLLLSFNNVVVSGDANLSDSFERTKRVIKDLFKTIYDTKGNKAWDRTPARIKRQGGPAGVANSASKYKPE